MPRIPAGYLLLPALAVIPMPAFDADTTWFGGTRWDEVDVRWEGLSDSLWTFDTGVGSAINDDPSRKLVGLHSRMEGWGSADLTGPLGGIFRRLREADFTGEPDTCVGLTGRLRGEWSMWAGLMESEADEAGYIGGQGYGNRWEARIGQLFECNGLPVHIRFNYTVDLEEAGFDLAYLEARPIAGGGGLVWWASGTGYGQEMVTWTPPDSGMVWLYFVTVSDAAYSDEDGLFDSTCGAFGVDNILITGGITHSADFETGDDGWSFVPNTEQGHGLDLSHLRDIADLPTWPESEACPLTDSVLVFAHETVDTLDDLYHTCGQNNRAVSPWIDLQSEGLQGQGGFLFEFEAFYLGGRTGIGYVPECQWMDSTGVLSDFVWTGWRISGSSTVCAGPGGPHRVNFTGTVPDDAAAVRLGIRVYSFCLIHPDYNMTPWFDNVRFGVYKPGPTPARLSFFTVDWTGNEAVLRWATTGISDHAGFHVYREQPGTGRKRMTEHALGGRSRYEFRDETAPPGGADYWLAEISRSGEMTWHGPAVLEPILRRMTLSPGLPNPFASTMQITYTLPEARPVSVDVYDIQGRRVAALVDEAASSGEHTVRWDGRRDDGTEAPSGLYIIRFEAGRYVGIRKVILAR